MVKKKTSKKEPRRDSKKPPKKDWRSIIWYLFFTFFLISLITASMSNTGQEAQINFSQFLNELDNG